VRTLACSTARRNGPFYVLWGWETLLEAAATGTAIP